jgi:hypothetical protein
MVAALTNLAIMDIDLGTGGKEVSFLGGQNITLAKIIHKKCMVYYQLINIVQ